MANLTDTIEQCREHALQGKKEEGVELITNWMVERREIANKKITHLSTLTAFQGGFFAGTMVLGPAATPVHELITRRLAKKILKIFELDDSRWQYLSSRVGEVMNSVVGDVVQENAYNLGAQMVGGVAAPEGLAVLGMMNSYKSAKNLVDYGNELASKCVEVISALANAVMDDPHNKNINQDENEKGANNDNDNKDDANGNAGTGNN